MRAECYIVEALDVDFLMALSMVVVVAAKIQIILHDLDNKSDKYGENKWNPFPQFLLLLCHRLPKINLHLQ